jgi:hypothetical protein
MADNQFGRREEIDVEEGLVPTKAPPSAKMRSIEIEPELGYLLVGLTDGRRLSVPLGWYPTLQRANKESLLNVQVIGAGHALEWQDLDYHLSLEGMLLGRPEHGVKVPS